MTENEKDISLLESNKGRDILYKKYNALVHKICNQFIGKLPLVREDIIGAAEVGFTMAMNNYKSDSTQTFKQYAAWCMRNYILTSANTEGHLIKLSAYQQNKLKMNGNNTFVCVPFSTLSDDNTDYIKNIGFTEDYMKPSDNSIMYSFNEWMKDNYSNKERDIFYHTYGISGYDELKCIEIAKMYNVSAAYVSIVNKRILNKIRENKLILNTLQNLI